MSRTGSRIGFEAVFLHILQAWGEPPMDRALGISGDTSNNGSEPTTAPNTESASTSEAAPSLLNSLNATGANAPTNAAYHLIRYKNGNQALQLDNGLELISLKDGTKIGKLPNGYRYIIQPDGTTTCIAPDGSVIA